MKQQWDVNEIIEQFTLLPPEGVYFSFREGSRWPRFPGTPPHSAG